MVKQKGFFLSGFTWKAFNQKLRNEMQLLKWFVFIYKQYRYVGIFKFIFFLLTKNALFGKQEIIFENVDWYFIYKTLETILRINTELKP